MKSVRTTLIFLIFGIILLSCNDKNSDTKPAADLSFLAGKALTLKIDRILESPDVQSPADQLEDKDYRAFIGDKIYTISFSEDGKVVNIEPGSMRGNYITSEAENITFELSEGVFAGGRFVVRSNGETSEAELTIYGSGVPIVLSERGNLL